MNRRVLTLCLVTLGVLGIGASAEVVEPLRLVATLSMPGVKGRFDHFSCDPGTQRLAVAALGNNTGELFDTAESKHLQSIVGLRKPTGTLLLAEPRRLCFANGEEGTLRSFDAISGASLGKLASLDDADNVRLDRGASRIYVGYGEGALGVTDTAASKILYSIALTAHPESFQLETHGPRIFVNVPEKKQIAVVDREQRKVISTWPMEKWQANFPMALDESAHRLYVGCRKPARLVMMDTERGVPVADVAISGDTDDLFFDAKRQRIYVSCGEGFLDVVQKREGDRYERIARITTRAGARTSYFSPEIDRLWLAVQEHGGQSAELRVYQPRD